MKTNYMICEAIRRVSNGYIVGGVNWDNEAVFLSWPEVLKYLDAVKKNKENELETSIS